MDRHEKLVDILAHGQLWAGYDEDRSKSDRIELLRRKRYDMDRLLLPASWMALGIDPNKAELKRDPQAVPGTGESPLVLVAVGAPLNVNDRKMFFTAILEESGNLRLNSHGLRREYLKQSSPLYENMALVSILLAKCATDTK